MDRLKDKFMVFIGRPQYGSKKNYVKSVIGSMLSNIPVLGPSINSLITEGTKASFANNIPFYSLGEGL
jgi:hypothetical protein